MPLCLKTDKEQSLSIRFVRTVTQGLNGVFFSAGKATKKSSLDEPLSRTLY